MRIKVAVLAHNAQGEPEFFLARVDCTTTQVDGGEHYDIAIADAKAQGYEGTMIAFDATDAAAKQLPMLARLFG